LVKPYYHAFVTIVVDVVEIELEEKMFVGGT
jgi:hypothetical protein